MFGLLIAPGRFGGEAVVKDDIIHARINESAILFVVGDEVILYEIVLSTSNVNAGLVRQVPGTLHIRIQKLHARGPMGLKELTAYKWIIFGTGHVRP